jgi:hypothetical protein
MESMFRVFDFSKGVPLYFGFFIVKITKNLRQVVLNQPTQKGSFQRKGPSVF